MPTETTLGTALKSQGISDHWDAAKETSYRFFEPLEALTNALTRADELATQTAVQNLLNTIARNLPLTNVKSDSQLKETWQADFGVRVDPTLQLVEKLRTAVSAAGLEGTMTFPEPVPMSPEQATAERARELLRYISGPNGYNTGKGHTARTDRFSPYPAGVTIDQLTITPEQAAFVFANVNKGSEKDPAKKLERMLVGVRMGDYEGHPIRDVLRWNVLTDPSWTEQRGIVAAYLQSDEVRAHDKLRELFKTDTKKTKGMTNFPFTQEQMDFILRHGDAVIARSMEDKLLFNPEFAEHRVAAVALIEGKESPQVFRARGMLAELGVTNTGNTPLTPEHADFIVSHGQTIIDTYARSNQSMRVLSDMNCANQRAVFAASVAGTEDTDIAAARKKLGELPTIQKYGQYIPFLPIDKEHAHFILKLAEDPIIKGLSKSEQVSLLINTGSNAAEERESFAAPIELSKNPTVIEARAKLQGILDGQKDSTVAALRAGLAASMGSEARNEKRGEKIVGDINREFERLLQGLFPADNSTPQTTTDDWRGFIGLLQLDLSARERSYSRAEDKLINAVNEVVTMPPVLGSDSREAVSLEQAQFILAHAGYVNPLSPDRTLMTALFYTERTDAREEYVSSLAAPPVAQVARPEGSLVEELKKIQVANFPEDLESASRITKWSHYTQLMPPLGQLVTAVESRDEEVTRAKMGQVLSAFAANLPSEADGLRTDNTTAIALLIDTQLRTAVTAAGLESKITFPEYGVPVRGVGNQPPGPGPGQPSVN